MDMQLIERPALRVGGIRHVGPYQRLYEAYQKLGGIAANAGLFEVPGVQMIGVYHDLADDKPEEELCSDASVSLPGDIPVPDGLTEQHIPGGRYAHAVHHGSYSGLADTWKGIMDEIGARDLRMAGTPCYEIYINNPSNTQEEDLRTEIFVPLE